MNLFSVLLVPIFICLFQLEMMAQVAISETNADPDSSAILDLQSTDKGLLIPRVDTGSINSPALGLLTFQPSDKKIYQYNGIKWVSLKSDILDDDGDTGIVLDQNVDDDVIRFYVNQDEVGRFDNDTLLIKGLNLQSGVISQLGSSDETVEGSIRYRQNDYEGFDGTSWRSFFEEGEQFAGTEESTPFEVYDTLPTSTSNPFSFGQRSDEIFADENQLITGPYNKKYLYRRTNNTWAITDSIDLVHTLHIDDFSNQEFMGWTSVTVSAAFPTVSRYSTLNDEIVHLETEVLDLGGRTIESLERKDSLVFLGAIEISTPRIGKVYIYNINTTPWTLVQTIDAPDTDATHERFGQYVHLSDQRLYIAATQNGVVGTGTLGSGVVHVYEKKW